MTARDSRVLEILVLISLYSSLYSCTLSLYSCTVLVLVPYCTPCYSLYEYEYSTNTVRTLV